jgi:DNA polymerase (family 10)
MLNEKIASTFERIADLLEIKGENIYKVLAYRRASESIRQQTVNMATLDSKALKEIPGIGQAIAKKILELSSTGKLSFLEELGKEVPLTLIKILELRDVGPKKAALFWKQANVTNLKELEAAARARRLRQLPGMGEKSEARILASIESLKK